MFSNNSATLTTMKEMSSFFVEKGFLENEHHVGMLGMSVPSRILNDKHSNEINRVECCTLK